MLLLSIEKRLTFLGVFQTEIDAIKIKTLHKTVKEMFENEGVNKTITGMNHKKYHVYGIENV